MIDLFLDFILMCYMAAACVLHIVFFAAWVNGYKWHMLFIGVIAVGTLLVSVTLPDINTHVFGFAETATARVATLVLACVSYVASPVAAAAVVAYMFSDVFRGKLLKLPE